MATEEEEEYCIPLQDQRVFGAGLKRKRVQFIPGASDTTINTPPSQKPSSPKAIGDHYLSIVLAKSNDSKPTSVERELEKRSAEPLCEICNLPVPTAPSFASVDKPHESSLAHQVCLTHSHPPSHIDRTRPGLKYLSSYGWDPDSRLGLGVTGEGIRIPIKGKVKNDTVGLGVDLGKLRKKGVCPEGKEKKLNAKEVRRLEDEGRKRRERLQEMFYRSEDLERYLGPRG